MYFYDCRIIWESHKRDICRGNVQLPGFGRTGENKPCWCRGSWAPGRRRWCQHEVMWLQDSLVRLIDLEPLPFLPGLPVSLPIIPPLWWPVRNMGLGPVLHLSNNIMKLIVTLPLALISVRHWSQRTSGSLSWRLSFPSGSRWPKTDLAVAKAWEGKWWEGDGGGWWTQS